MIQSFFIYDTITHDIIYRTINKELKTKEMIINEFKNNINVQSINTQLRDSNNIVISGSNFTYISYNNKFYVLVSMVNDNNNYIIRILDTIFNIVQNIKLAEFYKIFYVVDEIISPNNMYYIPSNVQCLVGMDSNEEKIYDMMMKNKELERIEAFKDIKAKNKYKELEREYGRMDRTYSGVMDRSEEQVYQDNNRMNTEYSNIMGYSENKVYENKNNGAAIKPATMKKSLEKKMLKYNFVNDENQNVILNVKERIKIITDKEGNIKDGKVEGNLNLIVNDKEYNKIEIEIENNDKYKINPNVKTIEKDNILILQPKKDYPLHRSISLIKWERTLNESIIDFVIWLSEIEDNKYSLTFEYNSKRDLKELVFYFNCDGEIDDNRLEKGDSFIQWKIKNNGKYIEREDSIEFITNTPNVYPIEVSFICDGILSDFNIKKVGDIGEWKEERVMEVEKFNIEE
ncbi:Coatomer subunit delta subunit [Spraguea lophii 42_110]|uniref:Coatomer subunit delta n=1 Tax=Spraguea lophii (strain 42_110) TaxID=1358809 RepID=S7XTF8_SPRLO|nr:Coatomer subunit delta subunit [Spraguea lophii 42_110]